RPNEGARRQARAGRVRYRSHAYTGPASGESTGMGCPHRGFGRAPFGPSYLDLAQNLAAPHPNGPPAGADSGAGGTLGISRESCGRTGNFTRCKTLFQKFGTVRPPAASWI